MLDLLGATLAVTVLVALGLAMLSSVTLLPFFVTLQRADALRFSTARWGAVSLVGSLLSVAWVLLVLGLAIAAITGIGLPIA